MKSLWLFACLLFSLLVFFGISCVDTARLGLYHYVYTPSTTIASHLYSVYLDPDFGEADRISIQEALDQWNIALHGQAQFVVQAAVPFTPTSMASLDARQAFLIIKIDSHYPMVQLSDARITGYLGSKYRSAGFTDQVGGRHIYLIRDRLDNTDVKFIAMHELGHALGAEHGGGGLMSIPYNKGRWQCIDRYTMQQVAAHERLPAENLNYCVVGVN